MTEVRKPVFYDMVHSNNAASIRLWMKLTKREDEFEVHMVTYADLKSDWFRKISPLGKVPAFILPNGKYIFESRVIMNYLQDKYGRFTTLPTAEDRAFEALFCRTHDVYISSPNCTQPGFSHTQGCMYLAPYETKWCDASRVMDRPTRAAKLAEIWKQLGWLEENMIGPFLAGDVITSADMTWFPTTIFMEFMLPRVFGWPKVFREKEHFPRLAAWFELLETNEVFSAVRLDIWNFWVKKEEEGQFESIKGELVDTNFKWVYP
mmetsp:Transcript_32217/g.70512  ORF Transcript_32217/g.70512 Transcript_32217/m.70512 type:complete len:263 (-) Transcript_32217:366-1154(-)